MLNLARRNVPERARPAARELYRNVRRAYAAIAYRGSTVQCPCCDWQGRKFLAKGDRDNALCPRCGSAERHRFLWLYLTDHYDKLIKEGRILHFAPETGIRDRIRAVGTGTYTSADLTATNVDYNVDITDMIFNDSMFDCVLCSHVLEHVPNDRKGIREIARVLAPGGTAFIQVPVYDVLGGATIEDPAILTPADRERAYGQFDHVRKYGSDFKQRLEEAGMSVKVVDPSQLPQATKDNFALVSQDEAAREEIYVCSRIA